MKNNTHTINERLIIAQGIDAVEDAILKTTVPQWRIHQPSKPCAIRLLGSCNKSPPIPQVLLSATVLATLRALCAAVGGGDAAMVRDELKRPFDGPDGWFPSCGATYADVCRFTGGRDTQAPRSVADLEVVREAAKARSSESASTLSAAGQRPATSPRLRQP